MSEFKIGVISDSFRLPLREGVAKAKEMGAHGIQVYAVEGELCPENMDIAARQDFRRFVNNTGLEIAALCGDLGGHGFQLAEENAIKVPRSKAIVDLAVDLGGNVVTTHIGVVPGDRESNTYGIMRDACRELGDYAAKANVTFAIETGPEPAATLKQFIDDVGSKGIGVNLDPANLVMVLNHDPVEAVRILGAHIVHTHAKDGVHYQDCDAAEVYGAFADGGFAELVARTGDIFAEVPLGEGDVPWEAYLRALQEVGFAGYLTIEREVGDNPEADIRKAVNFLAERI